MKRINSVLVVAVAFVFVLSIATQVYALSISEHLISDRLLKYSEEIKQANNSLIQQRIKDIPITVTLRDILDIEELENLSIKNGVEMVMVQARGYDSNGDRVTFMSKTHKGLKETDRILREMAIEDNVKFVGYISFFAISDYEVVEKLQENEHVFLVDTSSYSIEQQHARENGKGVCFPHPLSWELESVGAEKYE